MTFEVLEIQSFRHMMLKKRSTDKISLAVQKKFFFGRVVEGSFLSKAVPKKGCFSYLITIRVILHKPDVSFLIIAIRYDDHPLFGPAVNKNKHSTARPKKGFFAQKSGDLFFSITCMFPGRKRTSI